MLHPKSHSHGEGQIVGETTAAMIYNLAFSHAVAPIVSVYTNGYFLRFISCQPTERFALIKITILLDLLLLLI